MLILAPGLIALTQEFSAQTPDPGSPYYGKICLYYQRLRHIDENVEKNKKSYKKKVDLKVP